MNLNYTYPYIVGRISDICDNIVTVQGVTLNNGELIYLKSLSSGVLGFVWDMHESHIRIPLLKGRQLDVSVGDKVWTSGAPVPLRCGFGVLGEIISPLGEPLVDSDSSYREVALARLFQTFWRKIENSSPEIIERSPVTIPLMTGVASIDCLIPVGFGQRQLIIGDQNTGKTSLAITIILNQGSVNNDICGVWREYDWCNYKHSLFVPCIYVAVGSRRSEIVRIRKVLHSRNALHYTSIVFTSSDDRATLQYIAPYAGCVIGEWFRDYGYNSLVVYDDLSKHAIAFRQIALLLRRPPGREAYPGDVFFLHARLLERSAQLLKGGSLTAFPVIQTLGGDISAYISTNVISITDGQIFLVKSLVNKGIRPAVDLGLSVSRVGSAAQYSAMVFVSKRVKSIFTLYRIYAGLAKIAGEDGDIMLHVNRGERMLSFFAQSLYQTYSLYKQVICLYALTIDSIDAISPSRINLFFSLLGIRHLSYLANVDKKLVSFFLDPKVLEPLLIVFSFELIKDDLTRLLKHFRKFFISNIQENSHIDAIQLVSEYINNSNE